MKEEEEEAALGLNSRTFFTRFFFSLFDTTCPKREYANLFSMPSLKKKLNFFPLKNGIPTLVYYFRHVS